jgi:excisionase family DNA binding protein
MKPQQPMTVAETATELNLSPSRILHLIQAKRLAADKFGKVWMLTRAEVDRFSAIERTPGRPWPARD